MAHLLSCERILYDDQQFNWHTRIGKFSFGTCGGGGEIVLQARAEGAGKQTSSATEMEPG